MNPRDLRSRFLVRMEQGLRNLRKSKYGIISVIVYTLLSLFYLVYLNWAQATGDTFTSISASMMVPIFYMVFPFGFPAIIYAFSHPIKAHIVEGHLRSAGIVSHTGQPPILKNIIEGQQGNSSTYVLCGDGIDIPFLMERKEKIENALNIRIDEILSGKNAKEILIRCVPGDRKLPEIIPWRNRYCSENDAEFVLGESLTGQVKVSFDEYAHMLIGGQTGSGKSELVKLLIKQASLHGSMIMVADFKGGGDYSYEWYQISDFVYEKRRFVEALSKLKGIIESRKKEFHDLGVRNLIDYRKISKLPIKRIILVCDEAADLLERDSNSKEDKELQEQIGAYLAFIARQGRAFGVHLILAMQRPDAEVLKGQIKANLGYRVCGRADRILSQMLLDSSNVSDILLTSEPGVFVNHRDEIFKAYYLDPEDPVWSVSYED